MTSKELPDHLSETLRRLDQLAKQTPREAPLQKLIDEAREPLATLIGYLAN